MKLHICQPAVPGCCAVPVPCWGAGRPGTQAHRRRPCSWPRCGGTGASARPLTHPAPARCGPASSLNDHSNTCNNTIDTGHRTQHKQHWAPETTQATLGTGNNTIDTGHRTQHKQHCTLNTGYGPCGWIPPHRNTKTLVITAINLMLTHKLFYNKIWKMIASTSLW